MSYESNSMAREEKMRKSRRKANVYITKILQRIINYDSTLICVFEGNDAEYYGSRIDMHINDLDRENVQCKGKDTVLAIRDKVKKNSELSQAYILYFVDKDFDSPITYDDLYCTPCYSIENLYVNQKSFENLLKDKLHISRLDNDILFNNLIELFKDFEYDSDISLKELNAWIKVAIEDSENDDSITLNLNNVKISKFIKINKYKVSKVYDKNMLSSVFNIEHTIDEERFQSYLNELESSDLREVSRGKYRLAFYREFLKQLRADVMKRKGLFKGTKISCPLELRNDLVSELSSFAKTPDCLKKFLINFKESRQVA